MSLFRVQVPSRLCRIHLRPCALPPQGLTNWRTGLVFVTVGFALVGCSLPTLPTQGSGPNQPHSTATPHTAIAQPAMGTPTAATHGVVSNIETDVLHPGALRLTATFTSIGIEVLFSGDTNRNATASLSFKPAGASDYAWREGLSLHRTAPNPDRVSKGQDTWGAAFYGSALLLEPETSYQVRVTFSDPDGVIGPQASLGTISTRAEHVANTGAFAPTHFVSHSGSDAHDGLTARTAWATLQKAWSSAPAGAVVRVAPGIYTPPNSARTLPLTLVAQHAAVGNANRPIDPSQRTIVESSIVTSPAGSAGPNAGVWVLQKVVGPGNGGAPLRDHYSIWKWASSVSGLQQMGYGMARTESPRRVASWSRRGSIAETVEGWVELLYTNKTYNYGWTQFGNDIYLRLPEDADPNSFYLTFGRDTAFQVDGPTVRLSGLEVRQFGTGVEFQANSAFGVIDHMLFSGNQVGVTASVARQKVNAFSHGHVVERSRFQDHHLWRDPATSEHALPWAFVKGGVITANDTDLGRMGDRNEVSGVGGSSGWNDLVVRHNTFEGLYDGVGLYHYESYRYTGANTDIHDNLFRRLADDGLDPARETINWRVWRNRFEETLTVLSCDPCGFGPVYFFRNEAWRTGAHGTPLPATDYAPGAYGLKYKPTDDSEPMPRLIFVNNTFWTDSLAPAAVSGAGSAGGLKRPGYLFLRNNIIRTTRDAFDVLESDGHWNEDFNHFATSARRPDGEPDESRGLKYAGRVYRTEVETYRAAAQSKEESTTVASHTNRHGNFVTPEVVDAAFVGPKMGDLRLRPGAIFVDAGVPVPNLSDRPGVDFSGAAPDLGAHER